MRKVGFVAAVLAAVALMVFGFRPMSFYLFGTPGMFTATHCEQRGDADWECFGSFSGFDGTQILSLRLDRHQPAPMAPGDTRIAEVPSRDADAAYRITAVDWVPFIAGASLLIAVAVLAVRRALPDYDDPSGDQPT